MKTNNVHKDKIQREAVKAVEDHGGRGIVVKATGTGKSRVPIIYMQKHPEILKVALIVPTEELRDNNWRKEFSDWDADELFLNVKTLCYASAHKIKGEEFDLVILDECHRITPLNKEFFDNNKVKDIIALTATLPSDLEKKTLLKGLGLNPVYTVTLDEAEDLGLVAPFDIEVFEVELDSSRRYVKAGSKSKPFLSTERSFYNYLEKQINAIKELDPEDVTPKDRAKLDMLYRKRMHFIYNLKSKTVAAKWLLDNIPVDKRVITFCSNIEQAETLCEDSYHSKNKKKNNLLHFINQVINRLTCVNALNEGVNIPNLDVGVVVQANSNEINLIQRIGRVVRVRPGHRAKIYIFVASGTQDMLWLDQSLAGFDPSKITRKKLKAVW